MYGVVRSFLIGGMLFVYIMTCMACVICVKTRMKLMTDRFDAWMEGLEKREEEFYRRQEYAIRMFLIENGAEVKGMCITEYKEAETMKMFREESREEGENSLGELVSMLLSKGREDDIQMAVTDKEARKRLYEEFNII